MRIIFFISFFLFLYAESFQEYQKNINSQFKNYKLSLEKYFKEYKDTLNKEFEKYKKELSKYWYNPEIGGRKVFVEYSKDKKVKKKVDFEKNYIEIDVIAKDKKEAKIKLKKALINLSTETTKKAFFNNPVLVKVDKKFKKLGLSSNLKSTPIIRDVLPPKKLASALNKSKFSTANSKLKNHKVYKLKILLPKNTYLIKAKKYQPIVYKNSNKFKIMPHLIFAIIHTESSYNPLARSYVPAFGLMQIVPQTAGKDVTKMLYGKPKLLTPSYLYNEKNNILIGSGYLKRLYYVYLNGVKNPLSRLFLTIAAYNTGPGNVACVFNSNRKDFRGRILCYRQRGDYSIKKALPKINSLSSKEVYVKLIKDLRYEEARNYLKKVFTRFLMYKKMLDKNLI